MKKTVIVDANIIIRYLVKDDPKFSPLAKDYFDRARKGLIELYLDEVTVAEVIWTLSSFYKARKEDIVEQLTELISQNWVINPRKKLLLASLEFYSNLNLSFIDCWIYTISQSLKAKLVTFDKKLRKLASPRAVKAQEQPVLKSA